MIKTKNGIPYIPLTLFHCGRHKATSFAYTMTGSINNLFSSGTLIIGTSGNTINTPPFSSASNASSNALPTS